MREDRKKARERRYAEAAARMLGTDWRLGERETPDFLVVDGERTFGLEVSSVFVGDADEHGNVARRREGALVGLLEQARREYEDSGGVSLRVKVSGRYSCADMGDLVVRLRQQDLDKVPLGHSVRFDLTETVKIHATRAFRPDWLDVETRVGWVVPDSGCLIQRAIDAKADLLSAYRVEAGEDIRLLLVADRHLNSGRIKAGPDTHVETRGFDVVYFISFPEPPIRFWQVSHS